jgi:hypothetical protein
MNPETSALSLANETVGARRKGVRLFLKHLLGAEEETQSYRCNYSASRQSARSKCTADQVRTLLQLERVSD